MTQHPESKRLKILNEDEVKILYARPKFNHEERLRYFTLSAEEAAVFKGWPVRSRAYGILQIGQFKARQQFFPFDREAIEDDLRFIADTHLDGITIDNRIALNTQTKQQRTILRLYNYRACHAAEREQLETKAAQLAK